MGALTSLFGGGLSAGGGGPSRAENGDASAGLTNSFQYNAGFTVGGSGRTSAEQSARQDQSAATGTGVQGGNNTLVYVSIGIGVLSLLVVLLKK